MKSIMRILSVAAVASLLVGCGGGGGNSAARTGKLSLKVIWPKRTKLIPARSNSIRAVVTGGAQTLGSQLIVGSDGPLNDPSIVTFNNLPVGAVTLTATAFPQTDGTGVAQATGAVPASIVAGQTTQVTVTMASTIDHLTISPANPTINVGASQQLIMTAFNLQNEVVLTAPSKVSWNSGTPAKATVTNAGNVTGVAAGTSLTTVSESESGKSANTTVTVNTVQPPPNTGPIRTALDVTGKFLYVSDGLTSSIGQFKVNADGTLTRLTPASVPVTLPPYSLQASVTPGSHILYVGVTNNNSGAIYQFNINVDGTLTPLNPATVPSTSQPLWFLAEPTGKFLYAVDHNEGIRQFIINQDGTLTQNGTDIVPELQLFGAAVTTDGKYVYTHGGGVVQEYKINVNGTLSAIGSAQTAGSGEGMSINPAAPFLYKTYALAGVSGVEVFQINANGSLTKVGANVPFGVFAYNSAVTPNGKNFYISSLNTPNNQVAQYAVNQDGTLTPLAPATVVTGTFPTWVSITPDGKFLYVTNNKDNTISQFKINADGTLTPLIPPVVAG